MDINFWLLILAILIFSLLVFTMYKKQQKIEKFMGDSSRLQKYINNFYKKFLKNGTKYIISYPIYYINMDKDTERKTSLLQDQKTYIEANLYRIPGFNGKEIENKQGDSVDGITFENYYDELSKGEIGCCISHLIAIYTAWKRGDEIAIICEDDISFCTTSVIPNLEDVIDNAPDDWEILQLCSFQYAYNGNLSSDIQYIKRQYPNSAFWSCGLYMINRKGMKKILNTVKKDIDKNLYSIKPIRNSTPQEFNNFLLMQASHTPTKYIFPLSAVADAYIYDLANTYSTFPSLFLANNSELDSTIHIDHTSYHLKNSLNTAERLSQMYL
jgi:GR25 family glycosyltransferase involved in LPS biosynthesis